MKVKLAIVGSRGFQDYDALSEFIDKTIKIEYPNQLFKKLLIIYH